MWEELTEGDVQCGEHYFFVCIFYGFLLSSCCMCSDTLLSYLYKDSVATDLFST